MSTSLLRLAFSRIAATSSVIAITMIAMTAAQTTNQESSSVSEAVKANNRLFAVYMFVLVIGAVLSYFVWTSGNRVQDAIRAEANARIEEAKTDSGRANERAALANERTSRLELETAAANERAAKLAIQLSDVTRKQGPRLIAVNTFVLLLKGREKFNATVKLVLPKDPLESESQQLAAQFWSALNNAGWKAGQFLEFIDASSQEASWVRLAGVMPPATTVDNRTPEGVIVLASSISPRSKALEALYPSLQTLAFGVGLGIDQDLGQDTVRIIVGPKP